MTTITILEYTSYILVLVLAMWQSHKVGEKSGSIYMLSYLRENTYEDSNGLKVPFLNDTGYNRFMTHMRKEKELKDNG
jgi:hypothetical protein